MVDLEKLKTLIPFHIGGIIATMGAATGMESARCIQLMRQRTDEEIVYSMISSLRSAVDMGAMPGQFFSDFERACAENRQQVCEMVKQTFDMLNELELYYGSFAKGW